MPDVRWRLQVIGCSLKAFRGSSQDLGLGFRRNLVEPAGILLEFEGVRLESEGILVDFARLGWDVAVFRLECAGFLLGVAGLLQEVASFLLYFVGLNDVFRRRTTRNISMFEVRCMGETACRSEMFLFRNIALKWKLTAQTAPKRGHIAQIRA